jgi:hypothetical protein
MARRNLYSAESAARLLQLVVQREKLTRELYADPADTKPVFRLAPDGFGRLLMTVSPFPGSAVEEVFEVEINRRGES